MGRKQGEHLNRLTLAIRDRDKAKLDSIDDSPTLALRLLLDKYGEALDEIKRLKDTKRTKLELARTALTTSPPTTPTTEPTRRKPRDSELTTDNFDVD